MPGGDLSSFEARYSFCLDRAADVLDIFFSFSLFLLGSVYSRISLACFVYNFLNSFTGFFVTLRRIPKRLQSGVMYAVPVKNVWFLPFSSSRANSAVKN